MSDTPRTDAEFTDDYYVSGFVPTEFAQQLERELAAVENEMAVMSDKLTCALFDAKENEEIANEFKLTMQDLEAKLKEKNGG